MKVILIKKNKCNFDKLGDYANELLYHSGEFKNIKTNINNYIWSVIEPYIEFINVDDFLNDVCLNLIKPFDKNPDDFFYHTEQSYSFPNQCIEIIYAQPLWDYHEDNINNIGCLFSLKHTVIENNCIILINKYDLTAKNYAVMDDITKKDILRVIRRRFFFSAILIKNNKLIKYYYQEPKILIKKIFNLNENDNIQKLSFNILRYNFVFYFKQDDKVNEIATRINGLYKLYGDVLIINEIEENVYANLSINEINKLNLLSFGSINDRELKDNEKHDIGDDKTIIPFWSKYIIVKNRLEKLKDNCYYCHNKIINPVICEKCYRIKYCSKDCQQKHNHFEDCIQTLSL